MTASEPIRLLEIDTDLGVLMTDTRRKEAEQELVVRTHRLGVGPWNVSRLTTAGIDHIGLLILDGVIAREVVVADHVSIELLGPGDIVRPWQQASRTQLLSLQVVWSVMSPAWLAVLDRRFGSDLARWPEVTPVLLDRVAERSLRLATTQAISQLTRVDRRLMALFWHLAERWGRVSGEGVVVPLALTHRTLGQLVGARRPTVSTALSDLANRGELIRRPNGSWLLLSKPPSAPVHEDPDQTSRRRRPPMHDLLRRPRTFTTSTSDENSWSSIADLETVVGSAD